MARPRVLFDTNLYLNYLVSPDPTGTAVDFALDAGAEGKFDLLLPDDVLAELASVVDRRPYLAARIGQSELEALIRRVLSFATSVAPLEDDAPPVCRDPRDDYLLALAVLHGADYIVTRDKDLLSLEDAVGVRIVDPGAFLGFLRSEQR